MKCLRFQNPPYPPFSKGEILSPLLLKGDWGLPCRDLVAICRNLTKQLWSITLCHNLSRPGLGQGGFYRPDSVRIWRFSEVFTYSQLGSPINRDFHFAPTPLKTGFPLRSNRLMWVRGFSANIKFWLVSRFLLTRNHYSHKLGFKMSIHLQQ